MKKTILLVLTVAFIAVNCTKNKAEQEKKEDTEIPCNGVTVSYKDVIEAQIINPSCNTAGCHNSSAAGGYSFTNFDAVADNADLINSAINHEGSFTPMPIGADKLSDTLLTQFKCWIDQGKLNN